MFEMPFKIEGVEEMSKKDCKIKIEITFPYGILDRAVEVGVKQLMGAALLAKKLDFDIMKKVTKDEEKNL